MDNTSQTTNMVASLEVLETYELVELTLLHLPLKDLLLAQRVCKGWQSVWKRSQNIQRALFLLPSSDVRIRIAPERGEYIWETIARNQDYVVTQNPILNPFMKRFIYFDGEYTIIKHVGLVSPTHPSGRLAPATGDILALHQRDASWRKMLFSQPAAEEIAMYCSRGHGTEFPDTFLLKQGGYMTVGGVVDGLREHWFSCPNCPYPNHEPGEGGSGEEEEEEEDGDVAVHDLRSIQWELQILSYVQEVTVEISGWEMLACLLDLG